MRLDRRRPHAWAGAAITLALLGWLLHPAAGVGSSVQFCPVPFPPATWSTRALGTSSFDVANDVAVDNAICAVFTGGETSGALGSAAGAFDGYLARYSTTGALVWLQQFGSTASDEIQGIAVDAEHNVYVVGSTDGMLPGSPIFNLGGSDAFLAKYDQNGTLLWTRQLGSISDDYGQDVAVGESGDVFITGWTTGALLGVASFGGRDYFLARYDVDGNLLMLTQRGSSGDDIASAVAVGPGGSAYVVGDTDGLLGAAANGSLDIFVAKYDTAGTELWVQQRGTVDFDIGSGVAVNSDGQVFVVGACNGSLDGNVHYGALDAVVIRYDANGTWRWTDQRGTIETDIAEDVAVSPGGAPYTTGMTGGDLDGNIGAGGSDVFVMKHGRGGAWRWTSQLGNASENYATAIAIDDSEHPYLAGYGAGTFGGIPNVGSWDAFVVKYDSSGILR